MRKTTDKVKSIKSPPSSTDEDYNLWVLMRQVRDAMGKARERELGKYGISSIQGAVLFNIKEIGRETTPAEISRRLVREPHSVSGLLSRMEKQGLIKRVKDLPRRNMIRIVTTKKGEEAYKLIAKRLSMVEIMSSLTEDEKNTLWNLLQKLRTKSFRMAGINELPFSDPSMRLVPAKRGRKPSKRVY